MTGRSPAQSMRTAQRRTRSLGESVSTRSALIGTRSRRANWFVQNASKSAGSGVGSSRSGCTPAPPSKKTDLGFFSNSFIAFCPSGVDVSPVNFRA